MKKQIPLLAFLLLIVACNANEEPADSMTHFYAPKAGTIVAADSFRITENELNEFYYAVKIISTDSSNKGYYFLDAHWGHNDAQTELAYPVLQEEIIPAIERDRTKPYAYILGFKYRNNDTFHDYAEIKATKISDLNCRMEMKYLKSYFIDSVEKK